MESVCCIKRKNIDNKAIVGSFLDDSWLEDIEVKDGLPK